LFSSVLTKPVKPSHLEKTIRSQFQARPAKADPAPAAQHILDKGLALEKPLDILVAEDNLINQKMILKVLEKLGYNAALANNGVEAIRMLDKQYYDLIFMDVQMPEMDGLECTRYIRKHYAKQPVIIAMTANAMVEDREVCLKAGMNNYIAKPVKMELLVSMIKETNFNTVVNV